MTYYVFFTETIHIFATWGTEADRQKKCKIRICFICQWQILSESWAVRAAGHHGQDHQHWSQQSESPSCLWDPAGSVSRFRSLPSSLCVLGWERWAPYFSLCNYWLLIDHWLLSDMFLNLLFKNNDKKILILSIWDLLISPSITPKYFETFHWRRIASVSKLLTFLFMYCISIT